MSMRDHATDDYGLVLDEETVWLIAKLFDPDALKEYSPDIVYIDELQYLLYEEGIVELISSFTGEALMINDDGSDNYGDSNTYSEDIIVFVQVSNYPTLFKNAYNNMDELVEEFKRKVGAYLPDNFDYRSRIRHIVGTYYG